MKTGSNLQISTSPSTQSSRKPRSFASLALRRRSIHRRERRWKAGKELDAETGLYYYGARYLDPKTSRWLSGDPALGEYVPQAGKGGNGLPGTGGVYNTVNLHAYHYAGNNPVKYTDPDGRNSIWEIDEENKKIEIKIPVKFSEGTTKEQKRAFSKAAKEWGGTYRLPGGFGRQDGNIHGSEKYYGIRFTVIETKKDSYENMEVNTVTFSPESYSEKEGRISNVQGGKDMTVYKDSNGSSGDFVNLLKHEITHLLGIEDKYKTKYDENGVRLETPPIPGWGNNIAARNDGQVDNRNFLEAKDRIYVNKKVFK
jgi:RHS repeat-associated protein